MDWSNDPMKATSENQCLTVLIRLSLSMLLHFKADLFEVVKNKDINSILF